MKGYCVIMDIDGTLANAEHRLHLLPKGAHSGPDASWDKFFAAARFDKPNHEIVTLNNQLARDFPVMICTGRPEKDRRMTIEWLKTHNIKFNTLMMRRDGDHRDDTIVKKEMLDAIRLFDYDPMFAVEDRKRVAQMWRDNGVRCLHVCEGDY